MELLQKEQYHTRLRVTDVVKSEKNKKTSYVSTLTSDSCYSFDLIGPCGRS
jgi:hypothetical protein